MTWVDGVVLAVIALSALIAYFRGFVREVLGIGAWAGAIAFALYAQPALKPLLVLKLLIAWFAGVVRHSVLGGVDRALGIVFGLARGAFLIVLAYIVGGLFLPSPATWPEAVRDARTLPVVADAARTVVSQLPADYRPRLPELPERGLPSMDELLRPPARGRS
jgi:membrane protein required for colicin V production